MSSTKIVPRVLRRLAVLEAVLALFLAVQIFGQSLASGRIVGTVRGGNSPLPGARVTVSTPDLSRSVIADAEARFEFSDLPQGAYEVTAGLVGFQTLSQKNVIVASGRTSTLDLVLQLDCLAEVVFVDLGLHWALQEADAILHLWVFETDIPQRWTLGISCLLGAEHVGTLIRVLKIPPGQGFPAGTIRFVQADTGRAYAPGDEYVALLRWEATWNRFIPVAGPLFMFPVRDGRVVWTRSDDPTLKDGMPVEDFLAAIEALLPARAQDTDPGR